MGATKMHGFLLNAAAVTLLAGCGTTEIASHWRDTNVVLSGSGSGWPASATVFEDRRMSAAVFNDSEYIYIGLRTTARDMQRLLLRQGITWWFDSQGGGKKSFGIHYPLPPPAQRPGEEVEGFPSQTGRGDMAKVPAELDLYSGEKEHQRISMLAAGGIEAKIHWQRDTLVYELRVPLSPDATHPIGIGVKRGAVIGLGAATANIGEAPDLPIDRAEAEGEPEGGFGGRRTGGRGGSRPDAGGRTEQLNLWMRIHLAVSP